MIYVLLFDIIEDISLKVEYSNYMKFFFLAGLPRSGNTLLSSILNQNPKIKVSSNSLLCDILYQTYMFSDNTKFYNFPDQKSLDNLLNSIFPSYYKDWDAKYVIDRGPWGTPANLELLKRYVSDDIKIICPVRSIVEIIASFIRINPPFIQSEIENEINIGLRHSESHKSDLEIKCEIITKPNGQLEISLLSLYNLLKEENKKHLHIVEYSDLVTNTKKTISKIYDFLEIEEYQHSYNYIEDFKVNDMKYVDSVWQSENDLHKINHTIKYSDYSIKDILPQSIIKKYSNTEFWRK